RMAAAVASISVTLLPKIDTAAAPMRATPAIINAYSTSAAPVSFFRKRRTIFSMRTFLSGLIVSPLFSALFRHDGRSGHARTEQLLPARERPQRHIWNGFSEDNRVNDHDQLGVLVISVDPLEQPAHERQRPQP